MFTRQINFWKKVLSKNFDINECWIWTACKDKKGYGKFLTDEQYVGSAHRYIYELYNGKIDDKLVVRHKCDNPSCVNPWHLEHGTHQDNVDDKISRGRSVNVKGEEHGMAKSSDNEIRNILNGVLTGTYTTVNQISKTFGYTRSKAEKIVRGETFVNVYAEFSEQEHKLIKKLVTQTITQDVIDNVKLLLSTGLSNEKTAKQVGISSASVSYIRNGKYEKYK